MTTDGAIHLRSGRERRGNSPRQRNKLPNDPPTCQRLFPSSRVSESFRRDDKPGERHFHCSGAAGNINVFALREIGNISHLLFSVD